MATEAHAQAGLQAQAQEDARAHPEARAHPWEDGALRIELITEDCVGAGQCVLAAPAVFDQDEDGVAIVLDEAPDSGEYEAVREAADLCPSSALRLLRATAQPPASGG